VGPPPPSGRRTVRGGRLLAVCRAFARCTELPQATSVTHGRASSSLDALLSVHFSRGPHLSSSGPRYLAVSRNGGMAVKICKSPPPT